MSVRVWVVQRVWRWPLKRRGFRWQGGVIFLQNERREMGLAVGSLGGRERGEGCAWKESLAWPRREARKSMVGGECGNKRK